MQRVSTQFHASSFNWNCDSRNLKKRVIKLNDCRRRFNRLNSTSSQFYSLLNFPIMFPCYTQVHMIHFNFTSRKYQKQFRATPQCSSKEFREFIDTDCHEIKRNEAFLRQRADQFQKLIQLLCMISHSTFRRS